MGSELLKMGTLNLIWTKPTLKNSLKSKCVVLIPVYKEPDKLSKFEEKSIFRTIGVLGEKYEIMLLCGDSLDTTTYNEHFDYRFSYFKCSDEFFRSRKSYSDLCEKFQFYETLKDYEYMLICQPDAWVFEDNLDYFTSLGYDYIGAIHMLKSNGEGGRVGNGGFSLRRISKFAEVCKKTDFNRYRSGVYEDVVFSTHLKNEFSIPMPEIGFRFGWQEQPQAAFKKCGKLPFGCHNPMKNNWSFWQQYIKITDKEFDSNEAKAITGVSNFEKPSTQKFVKNVIFRPKRIAKNVIY